MGEQVKVTGDAVVISKVECTDTGAVEYFAELADAQRPEAVCRAVTIGVAGLRAMGARADVDQVERGFEQLRREFQKARHQHRRRCEGLLIALSSNRCLP